MPNITATLQSSDKTVLINLPINTLDISEEDLRKKSCKFKTPTKIDTTSNRWEVKIYKNNNLIYGGVILSSTYDEKTGLYDVQSQGYNRWLNTKEWLVVEEGSENERLYDTLKSFLNKQVNKKTDFNNRSVNTGLESYYLAPREEYTCYPSEAIGTVATEEETEQTGMETPLTVFYEDKTVNEILSSLLYGNNLAVDYYVDDTNQLLINPLDLDAWTNPDTVFLSTGDLTGYNFKSDVTNIVTSVTIKDTDIYKSHTVTEPNVYSAEDMGFGSLTYYFGSLNTFVSNSSKNTSTTSTDESTGETSVTESVVDNTVENEKLARAKISEGLRDMMSFDIEFEGVIDGLHTNMFIVFELPAKHLLANYSSMVAGVDKTTTRGGAYSVNRFYVEKISISYKENGLTSKVTLNPFASDLSSYSKTYTDAISKYEQANCESSTSSTGATGSGYNKFGISADGSKILAIGMPSSGADAKYSYTYWKSVFSNKCPSCGANDLFWGWAWAGEGVCCGTFPQATDGKSHRYGYGKYKRGGIEGHVFCANCDADFSCVSGQDHWSSTSKNYLTRISGPEASTKDEARKLLNGEYANGGVTVSSTASTDTTSTSTSESTSTSCTSATSSSGDATGSYDVGTKTAELANRLTSSKDSDTIMKDCLAFRYGPINSNFYLGYTNFRTEPEQCLISNPYMNRPGANCCDGTRLYFFMVAYKGVATNSLVYRHIYNHVYGRYKNTDYDWVKGGKVGIHWGTGSFMKDTTFPNRPFGGLEENGYTSFDERVNEELEDSGQYLEYDFDYVEDKLSRGIDIFERNQWRQF